ncbi:hypothetical protein AB1Y20_009576 [Prymnesium parvum]|uniref:Protein-tyrosine-phosphatase n=1 Tax=Prymnesium parvum TaxID=97485 RepID=A0AB34K4A7_PRYPA
MDAGSGGLDALPPASPPPPPRGELDKYLLWYTVAVDFLYHSLAAHAEREWPAVCAYLASAYWLWALLAAICLFAPYFMFQKHWLPHFAGKWVGRIYFWPCIPCSVYGNKKEFKGEWFCVVGDSSPPVLLGQAPLFRSQLDKLQDLGVRSVVNLCDEFKGPASAYRRRGFLLLWLRTVDHLEPTVEAMRTACSFIEHHRAKGRGVYIHCKSGRGRSAAIAMGWLMQVQGMTPVEANNFLLERRKVRSKLFMQKNIIQYFDELAAANACAEEGKPSRRLSFAAPLPRQPSMLSRLNSVRSHGNSDVGSESQRVSQYQSHRQSRRGSAVLFGEMLRRPPPPQFAVSDAPPAWGSESPQSGGIWEIPVAPLEPSVPEVLPPWAQVEYDEQLQRMLQSSQQRRNVLGGRAQQKMGLRANLALKLYPSTSPLTSQNPPPVLSSNRDDSSRANSGLVSAKL